MLDAPKNAVSPVDGTMAGVQLAAVLKSLEPGLASHITSAAAAGGAAGQHVGGVARDHSHTGEDDQADEDQRNRRDEGPANDELDHAGATARTSP